ncbi:MAG: hypothetical protein H6Q75_1257 [Firmicutes bacterium]|nr:hypothetical protein [Bacillota bacterium]
MYSYMAIISLGAIVVPINTNLTLREILYIAKDAKMEHLITMYALDFSVADSADEAQNIKQLVKRHLSLVRVLVIKKAVRLSTLRVPPAILRARFLAIAIWLKMQKRLQNRWPFRRKIPYCVFCLCTTVLPGPVLF